MQKPTYIIFLNLHVLYNSDKTLSTFPITSSDILRCGGDINISMLNQCYDNTIVLAKRFDQTAVNNLEFFIEKLSEKYEVKIIITSCWKNRKNVNELKMLLSSYNFSEKIVDKSPESTNILYEIKMCILKNQPLSDFIIFDCKNVELNYFGKKYFSVDSKKLLTFENIDQILKNLEM